MFNTGRSSRTYSGKPWTDFVPLLVGVGSALFMFVILWLSAGY